MLVDSHCHLNCLDLTTFHNNLDNVIIQAQDAGVEHFLSVAVELEDFSILCELAEKYKNISISVGLHPNSLVVEEPQVNYYIEKATHPACIAIGETGLDYYRCEEGLARQIQQQRFRNHIQAALASQKPLIIHTRQAPLDTLRIMEEENAKDIGGVMHCFTESWEVAKAALAMNFYISLSGILTFKNATALQEVAKNIPLDRLLIETDAPYLAPIPYRGKQNHPALVQYVAQALAQLRQESYEKIAAQTTENFYRCFKMTKI